MNLLTIFRVLFAIWDFLIGLILCIGGLNLALGIRRQDSFELRLLGVLLIFCGLALFASIHGRYRKLDWAVRARTGAYATVALLILGGVLFQTILLGTPLSRGDREAIFMVFGFCVASIVGYWAYSLLGKPGSA